MQTKKVKNMKKVTFTVTDEEKAFLEQKADGNLSSYCREAVLKQVEQDRKFEMILDTQRTNMGRLQEVQSALRDDVSSGKGAEIPVELISCIFETLYMLRLLTKQEIRGQAKSAIERMGLPYIYNEDIEKLIRKLNL